MENLHVFSFKIICGEPHGFGRVIFQLLHLNSEVLLPLSVVEALCVGVIIAYRFPPLCLLGGIGQLCGRWHVSTDFDSAHSQFQGHSCVGEVLKLKRFSIKLVKIGKIKPA